MRVPALFDDAHLPTIIAIIGSLIAGGGAFAVANERIAKIEISLNSAPSDIAVIKATLLAQEKRLDSIDDKIDKLIDR